MFSLAVKKMPLRSWGEIGRWQSPAGGGKRTKREEGQSCHKKVKWNRWRERAAEKEEDEDEGVKVA